jgi:cation/acetate symporter
MLMGFSGPTFASSSIAEASGSTTMVLFVFLVLAICITIYAARSTRSLDDYFTAGGRITPLQNGLAIAGDFLSAGAFLGITAVIFGSGFDGIIYAVGYLASWPIVMFLVAGPLRNLGRFTVADALCYRLSGRGIRIMVAVSSLVIVVFYLVAQMVGAGQLIQLLLGVEYSTAVYLVGGLMISCVMIGGMVATTWIQIFKAILLLLGGTLIAMLTLANFGFDFSALLDKAVATHPQKAAILTSQILSKNPLSGFSLGLALMFGTAGLPHILMRFFTVQDGRDAGKSVAWGAAFIGYFFLLLFPIGFGAIALVMGNPIYYDAAGGLIGGNNTVAIHLSHAVGGNLVMAFISAVAFATILAVVAGLTLAGASAIAHDLLRSTDAKNSHRGGRGIWVSRISALFLGVVAMALALAFKNQNVVYMIGLAFAIAASANFPILVLSLYWSKLTSAGALAGGITGLVFSVLMTVLGPAVWVKVLGHAAPIVTLDPPTLLTMPTTFLVCWLVSVLDRSRTGSDERMRFAAQYARSMGDVSTAR